MDDKKIIELFFARSELAIVSLAAKYEKLLYKICIQIVEDREDAAECINDTYLGVWNAVPPTEPDPLLAYVCKIARNVSLNLFRKKKAAKRDSAMQVSLEELAPSIPLPSVEEEWSARELGRLINQFLHTLELEQRVLFVRRYWFADSVKDIAKAFGISENLVSVRLRRICKRLEKYLQKEGFFL